MIGILIWFVIIAMIIYSTTNRAKTRQQQAQRIHQQQRQQAQQVMNHVNVQQNNTYRAPEQAYGQNSSRRTMTDADRAKLEAHRQKKADSGTYVQSKPSQPNQELNRNQQRNAAQPNIVERAKANSKRYAMADETLQEMETEHHHSERVSTAVAGYVEEERAAHKRMHEEPLPPVEEVSLLGSVEDLIVKGYDGNLSFERDFIGEAEDMLSTFTLGTFGNGGNYGTQTNAGGDIPAL